MDTYPTAFSQAPKKEQDALVSSGNICSLDVDCDTVKNVGSN